jgi:tRNA pseudouridine13 synthase
MTPPELNHHSFPEWARVHADLEESAILRHQVDDFQVDERLPFEPDGEGEFALLRVEKRDANTDWVARQLAAFSGVSPRAVSYAGLKDRRALTWQWFSVHLPGRSSPNWDELEAGEYRVVASHRHRRKLRRGALSGNHFRIRLRNIQGHVEKVLQRAQWIGENGVPNYFGPQRFGRGGANLHRARHYYQRKIRKPARFELGMMHSAARAWVFNQVLSHRVKNGSWNQPLGGEIFTLDGSASVFGPEVLSEELLKRLVSGDIHTTGPMWGRGNLTSSEQVRALEEQVAGEDPELLEGLASAGLKHQRRSLRMPVRSFTCLQEERDLVLEFVLDRGCFATSVIRELLDYEQPGQTALSNT